MIDDIEAALTTLRNRRLETGSWTDKDETTGLVKTAEALECFFTPHLVLKDQLSRAERKFQFTALDAEVLIQDLDYLVDIVDKEGWSPSPYLDKDLRRIGYNPGVTDFTDSVSFITTALLDGIEYFEDLYGELPAEKRQRYVRQIGKGVRWLVENAITEGEHVCWSSCRRTPESKQYAGIYFSYTAAIALNDTLQQRKVEIPVESEVAQRLLIGCHEWMRSMVRYMDKEHGEKIPAEDFTNPASLLVYVLPVMQTVEDLVDPALLLEILEKLSQVYNDNRDELFDMGRHTAVFRLGDTKLDTPYEDRTVVYVMLEGMSWAHGFLSSRGEGRSPGAAPQLMKSLRGTIEEIRRELLKKQDQNEKLRIWDAGSFEIYKTQRAIEALTYYMNVFGIEQLEPKAKVITDSEIIQRAVAATLREMEPQLARRVWTLIERDSRRMPPSVGEVRPDRVAEIQERIDKGRRGRKR